MSISQKLKDAVLQAAVKGELTERQGSDSSVTEMIKVIQREKLEMLKSGLISRDKSFAINEEILEDIPFDIPDSWCWIRLGMITQKIGAGSTPTGGNQVYVTDGVKFLREQNIQNYGIDYEGIVYISEETNNSMKGSKVCAKDILVNITGASIGRCALVPDDFDIANVNQHVLIVRMVDESLRYYVHMCLQSPLAFNQMMERQKGDKPGLSATKVANFMIPIPPIEEQQRIVKRVGELLAKVNELEIIENKMIELKINFPSDMRSAILQAAMQGKLTQQYETDSSVRDLLSTIAEEKKEYLKTHSSIKETKKLPSISDDEIPFEIPENWAWVRWGTLSNNIQYGYNAPALPQGRIRMVRISDIQNNSVTWNTVPYCNIPEKEIENYKLSENDILFARTGGTVGKSYLVTNMDVEAIYASYLIRSNYNKRLCPQYLKYFMESPLYWMQLQNGTTRTAQPNCNGKTLAKMLIPIPPREEQQRIVDCINCLMPLCNDLITESA